MPIKKCPKCKAWMQWRSGIGIHTPYWICNQCGHSIASVTNKVKDKETTGLLSNGSIQLKGESLEVKYQ